ncbi:MAG TPA: cysteine desulfurase family protein [Phycisphaerales bacterium]|nr:cysteine desulfurase family protein [Phycisphaerales bacterium]
MIYLDNNATTQPSEAVMEAVARAQRELWQNPSSIHRGGQAARQAVELARASCAKLINAKAREIVFTSGGTEAIDLAIRGVLAARRTNTHATLVTSKLEHAAIRDLAEELERTKQAQVKWLELTRDGRIDVNLLHVIDASATLVAVQWANNETGAVQPLGAIAKRCKEVGVPLLVDGTQWVGKLPTDVTRVDDVSEPFEMLVVSPHKFHGPKGVGFLWSRSGVRMRPQILGTQELGRRGGTENVAGIIGAGVACEEAAAFVQDAAARERVRELRDVFERTVLEAVPSARVNGPTGDASARLWNTTNIGFPGLEAEALLLLLSERGVAASAGAACSSGSLDPSPVLLAFGVSEEYAHGSLRFSLRKHTTRAEVDDAAKIVIECVRRLDASWASVKTT